MKTLAVFSFFTLTFAYVAGQFGLWQEFKQRADVVYNFENKALELAQENRILKKEVSDLKAQVNVKSAEKDYLAVKLNKQERKIASIPSQNSNDLVQLEVYKWTPEKLLAIGEKEIFFKNYEKSAQYYNAYLEKFPNHQMISDKVLFEAGVAAYESKTHYPWAAKHFSHLVSKYPQSQYYRGAKLWLALSHLNLNQEEKFFETVEEFRVKYRNTPEWKILSKYYEDIAYKNKN
jgi:TolA-binding protein